MLIVGIILVLASVFAIIFVVNTIRLVYYFIRVYIFPPSTSTDNSDAPGIVIVEPEESEADRCFREYGEYYGQSYYF